MGAMLLAPLPRDTLALTSRLDLDQLLQGKGICISRMFKQLFILFPFYLCSAGPSINLKSSGKCQFCPSVAVRHSRSHTPTNQSSIKNTSRSKHHHYENCCIISKFHQKWINCHPFVSNYCLKLCTWIWMVKKIGSYLLNLLSRTQCCT